MSRLDAIDGNDQNNQALCASVLAAMNIAPVITIHIDFGRDNHNDTNFETETDRHLTTPPVPGRRARSAARRGRVEARRAGGSLNVSGRTLKKKGTGRRDHNAGHDVMVLMGNGLQGGVVGGIELNESGSEYIAASIDSQTGAKGGDIPFEETLGAAGKTLGAAMGVPEERLNEMLPPGKIVQSVLA